MKSARPEGYYERALWVYTDATSYAPGDRVTLFAAGPPGQATCRVERVGASRTPVAEHRGLAIAPRPIPADAYRAGCAWPETFAFAIGSDWPTGYYRVELRARGREAEHFFVLRSGNPGTRALHVLVLATNTYQAYNAWGGLNLYGNDAAFVDSPDQLAKRPELTPLVAFDRPFSRSLLHPPGPSRIPVSRRRGLGEPLGLPDSTGELVAAGASVWDMPAGFIHKWEHHFVAWAEEAGFSLDYLAQSDLDARPGLLAPYASYLSVGHDEYWTWEERDAVEAFVDQGGHASFLSGNTCFWQVRFEREGRAMVGHKAAAPTDDPVVGTERQARMTGMWSDPLVGRPETEMTGLSFARAGYARAGWALSRGIAGYTVYRPEHWCLAGTGLFYGDVFGDEVALCAYETDGCAFRFEDGRPVPSGEGGTPSDFEIVGIVPASLGEPADPPGPGLLGRHEAEYVAGRLFDGDVEKTLRGHAAFGSFRRGRGEVFSAGTTEWAWGLGADPFVERITRNVLERAAGGR